MVGATLSALQTLRRQFDDTSKKLPRTQAALYFAEDGAWERIKLPSPEFRTRSWLSCAHRDESKDCALLKVWLRSEDRQSVQLEWQRLANDAGQTLTGIPANRLGSLISGTQSTTMAGMRWILTVFSLGLQGRAGTPLAIDRYLLHSPDESVEYIKRITEGKKPSLPMAWESRLEDVFLASAYAIDILLATQ